MDELEILRNDGAAQLAMAIIQRAVDDYADLENRGIESRETIYEGDYSKEEIEEFFNSDYFAFILGQLNSADHGPHLFDLMRERTA